ncbi:MAG TPA: nucleotidyltransferase, partial [Bacteroidales bacterium]|nr:nucleotidyltransferase [Bacteroidales bacterium]
VLAEFLQRVEGKQNAYCMAGYRVGNTLSENGSVSRGGCKTDENGYLTDVVERTSIERIEGKIVFKDEDGALVELEENTPVSMNMWGFTPEYFGYSEEAFKHFLHEHGEELKSEFYIPTVVNDLITTGKATCKVLDTPAKWFGVTYAQDRQGVVDKIEKLIEGGVYPNKLF